MSNNNDFFYLFIDATRIVCGAGSMKRSSVCPSVRLSVCPSVCPIDRQQHRRAAGLLLSAVRAGDTERPAATAPQQQARAVSRYQSRGEAHQQSKQ